MNSVTNSNINTNTNSNKTPSTINQSSGSQSKFRVKVRSNNKIKDVNNINTIKQDKNVDKQQIVEKSYFKNSKNNDFNDGIRKNSSKQMFL